MTPSVDAERYDPRLHKTCIAQDLSAKNVEYILFRHFFSKIQCF